MDEIKKLEKLLDSKQLPPKMKEAVKKKIQVLKENKTVEK
jgi:ribonuclease HII